MRNFKFIICMFFIIGGFAHAQEGEAAKLESVTKDMLSVLYSDEYSDYTYEQRESAVQSILEQNYDVMVKWLADALTGETLDIFGVQSGRNRERDFSHGRPRDFILMGILFTACFVLIVWGVVSLVMRVAQ